MARKPKLTVLMGSGATVDLGVEGRSCGMPSTHDLTALIRCGVTPRVEVNSPRVQFEAGGPLTVSRIALIPVVEQVWKALEREFQETVDFELFLHAIETLEPYVWAQDSYNIPDEHRPVISSLTKVRRKLNLLKDSALLSAIESSAIKLIVEKINSATKDAGESGPWKMAEFVSELDENFNLSVFTLNYDDIIDRAREKWRDGFFLSSDGERGALLFDSRKFIAPGASAPPLLAHLHGSVRFAHGRGVDGKIQILKFENPERAAVVLSTTHVGEMLVGGHRATLQPIITGRQKLNRLSYHPNPFGYYFRAFADALVRDSRLLVVGYGGRDEHVNTWLREFKIHHGASRRVGWVTKITNERQYPLSPERRQIEELAEPWPVDRTIDHMASEHAQRELANDERGPVRIVRTGFPVSRSQLADLISHLAS